MDDLSNLNQELSSLLSDSDPQPTLLEQLETLQRKLHELHHVRDYIRTIHHALGLWYAQYAISDVYSADEVTASRRNATCVNPSISSPNPTPPFCSIKHCRRS